MFDSKIYIQRRKRLKKEVKSGVILFLGNEECPMNYPANTYHFRQDSSFLYFFGLDTPGLAGVLDADSGKDIIFGDDVSLEDIIWMGYLPSLKERSLECGIKEVFPFSKLEETIRSAVKQGRQIHFLPPYRGEAKVKLAGFLGKSPETVRSKASDVLTKAVVFQRSVKTAGEVDEMEFALSITKKMYQTAMDMARPSIFEREIVGRIEGIAISHGCQLAFPTILTINGQILHNHYHGNTLQKGRLLVIDSGAESPLHYASDITRTIPVGGKFSPRQRPVYDLALKAQEFAIQSIKPRITYKDIHIGTARVIASGLKELGVMKGDIDEAVAQGAHALFFPHGLGHMIGLDVHDMEGLGENFVGYNKTVKRSDQFGLAYLRMAKELRPGFVLTVEPGIYFIPALIDKWKKEKKLKDFINYEKLEGYRNFGGIRIEDDVLVTEGGHRVLGKGIPKKRNEIER